MKDYFFYNIADAIQIESKSIIEIDVSNFKNEINNIERKFKNKRLALN
jgi:hypothetical protein